LLPQQLFEGGEILWPTVKPPAVALLVASKYQFVTTPALETGRTGQKLKPNE
jgi:hypothetical protein